MEPLTVRVLSRHRDVCSIWAGKSIPKISERKARSVDELRSAGIGISQALLVHSARRRQRSVQGGHHDA